MDGNDAAARLLLDIRDVGRMPRRVQGGDSETAVEHSLSNRFRKARAVGRFIFEHEAALAALLAWLLQEHDQLMEDLCAFGRVPKEVKGSGPAEAAERGLAGRFRRARASGRSTGRGSKA